MFSSTYFKHTRLPFPNQCHIATGPPSYLPSCNRSIDSVIEIFVDGRDGHSISVRQERCSICGRTWPLWPYEEAATDITRTTLDDKKKGRKKIRKRTTKKRTPITDHCIIHCIISTLVSQSKFSLPVTIYIVDNTSQQGNFDLTIRPSIHTDCHLPRSLTVGIYFIVFLFLS